VPGLLQDEVAGKPVRRLDDDRARTVAGDMLEHGSKAWACIEGVRATDGLVVIFAYGTPGKGCNSIALAFVGIFVGSWCANMR
jgi:hypothetical protein